MKVTGIAAQGTAQDCIYAASVLMLSDCGAYR